MEFFTLVLLFSSLFTLCLAAPANKHLEERQRDKTYTITCLGPKCTDYPPTTFVPPTIVPSVPGGGGGQPTTTPKSTPKTTPTLSSKKSSSTSKYTPPVETKPTKTTQTAQQPTKTKTEESGPSSTKCPVPLHYQCGGYWDGEPWTGCTKCVNGAKCIWQNDFYYQCVADDDLA